MTREMYRHGTPNKYDPTKPWWWSYYGHEVPKVRKQLRRKDRREARMLLRQRKFDEVPTRQSKGTQGWISW